MKRILCFGDSNTWGHNSESKIGERLDNKFRWTQLLKNKLSNDYEIIEEGLNGRTVNTNYPSPEKWYKNGYNYIVPCLKSHEPLDLIIIMLGTNDIKISLKNTAEKIAKDLEYIINEIKKDEDIMYNNTKILIICPAKIAEKTAWPDDYDGIKEKSIKLEKLYVNVAKKTNCEFLSALNLQVGLDGIHLSKESHAKLAEMIFQKILLIYSSEKNEQPSKM